MKPDTQAVGPLAVRTLAQTLYGEARGEGVAGMVAVGWVILNRTAKPGWWGRSLSEVCLAPHQFSCWNESDPNRPQLESLVIGGVNLSFMQAYGVAALLLSSNVFPDPTGGATYYHTEAVTPKWAPEMERTTQLGHHVFYRERVKSDE